MPMESERFDKMTTVCERKECRSRRCV